MNYYIELLLVCAIPIPISLIWFGIHFFLKHKEKEGRVLSAKEKEWMGVSKFAGFLFLALPFISYIIVVVENKYKIFENIIGFFISVFIAIFVILPSFLRKGKF